LRIPRLGIIIPNMGSGDQESLGLASALFTRVQQRVLGILFGQPERSFLSKEVIQLARSGTGAVHRELKRLTASGLVTVSSQGWEKHYQANRQSPVFEELHSLIVKTVGLVGPLRESLLPLGERVRVAFVYGSQAKRTDTAESDVDLMVIGDDLTYAELYEALSPAEVVLARVVNPTILAVDEWHQKREGGDHFLKTVLGGTRLVVLGNLDDIG